VYIGDAGVKKVRIVTPDGMIRTVAGIKELDAVPDFTTVGGNSLYPQDYDYLFVAVDASGKVYVADEFRERILVLTPEPLAAGFAVTHGRIPAVSPK